MAQQVADILGCDLEMANGLFEAAGGDVGMAIELGFGGDGGDGGATPVDAAPAGFQLPYPHYNAIWPKAEPVSDAWQKQRLDAWQADDNDGIMQDANGPCGVLAVVQAELWLLALAAAENNNKSLEERLTMGITNILIRVMTASNNNKTENIIIMADGSQLPLDEAAKQIRTASALVEAVASTAGVGTTVTRMGPLVEGPHWLCSSDLMCLLLRGTIGNGNFSAFDAISKVKSSFYSDGSAATGIGIGMLSMMELDENTPVADDLKFDKQVWVIHTGDHFMTMRPVKSNNKATSAVAMEIYDGLKPAGPVTKCISVTGNTTVAKYAPDKHVETFSKKRKGQPDDLVQAKKTDADDYKEWKFEVVPAVEDPSVLGPLDDDPNEPVYNYQELPLPSTSNWRCGHCYSDRFKTMNFGTNPAGCDTCEVCHQNAREAMWSLWIPYKELSPRMQRRARQMYAPKLELILSTLYPHAEITFEKPKK